MATSPALSMRSFDRIPSRHGRDSLAQPHTLLAGALCMLLLGPLPSSLASCPGDLNGDGLVDGADLGALLSNFGGPGIGDLDGSGLVDGGDLGALLALWGAECPPPSGPRAIELAGKPLPGGYPHFDHTLTFNTGAAIHVRVDPVRHPEAVGIPATLYVVAARTAAEWSADASLVDVRGSGPQQVLFPGGDLESNAVLVDSGTLNGNGGLALGVGYDVVIDLDGSGTLSSGDLIDGYGDEPGFIVLRDLTLAGPLAVSVANYTVTGVTAGFTAQRAFYPSNIASLGPLPIVVISHGNGHSYTWYDYLGNHLASYGMVVMAHQNNTSPGIESASTTTLQHTQALIGQQGTIAGGVLNGKLDSSRIIWIGHSRGGEGVVRAYDRIFDGTFTPTNFGLSDIVLVSSIAPTDFLGTNSANPHGVNYHVIYGAADGDVCGCPNNDVANSFNLFERAEGFRASTYVHGADHNDFNCCGTNDFQGPAGTAIGSAEAQRVSRSTYLALIKHVLDGSRAGYDVLKRHYEDIRPPAISINTVVVNDLRPDPAAGDLIIEDYQTNFDLSLSSSGAAVTFSVTNLLESKSNDLNTSFTWLASDPQNGMVRGRTSDLERNAVFDYSGPAFLEFAVPSGAADLSGFTWLSFRAAQGTRHPNTLATLGNQTFLVTLRDGSGASRSVNLGAYGIGIQQPYARTGFGTGAGWQNEMELIRIRLDDFLVGGGGPDLTDIAVIRFDFGVPGTTPQGRLHFDDLRLTRQ